MIETDALFRYLVKLAVVENFYKRALRHGTNDGEENHSLVAPLITRDVPTIRMHIKQELRFRQLSGIDLRETFVTETKKKPKYILEKSQLSNKVFIHNLVQSVLRNSALRTIERLQHEFLPEDFLVHKTQGNSSEDIIGTRTQNALCAGLAGGRGYLIKQTAYGRTGLGKVCLFNQGGLAAEFFLAQDLDTERAQETYFHPTRRIVGILNEYPSRNKQERVTRITTPAQLKISVSKYLNISDKFFTNVNDLIKFFPIRV